MSESEQSKNQYQLVWTIGFLTGIWVAAGIAIIAIVEKWKVKCIQADMDISSWPLR